MAEHKCNQVEDIARMKSTVDRLVKIIEGNGQKGLLEIVTVMNSNMSNLTDAIKSLNVTQNEVLLYKSETEGYRKANASNKAVTRWAIGLSVASLLTVIGLILKK